MRRESFKLSVKGAEACTCSSGSFRSRSSLMLMINWPLGKPDRDISLALMEESTDDSPISRTPVRTSDRTVSTFFFRLVEICFFASITGEIFSDSLACRFFPLCCPI